MDPGHTTQGHQTADTDPHMVTTGHQTQDTPETGHQDMMNATANVRDPAAVNVITAAKVDAKKSTMTTVTTGIEVTVDARDSAAARQRLGTDLTGVGKERGSASV